MELNEQQKSDYHTVLQYYHQWRLTHSELETDETRQLEASLFAAVVTDQMHTDDGILKIQILQRLYLLSRMGM